MNAGMICCCRCRRPGPLIPLDPGIGRTAWWCSTPRDATYRELLAEDRSLEDLVAAVVDRFEVGTHPAAPTSGHSLNDLSRHGWIDL